MENNEVIRLDNVQKSYRIYKDKSYTLRERFVTRGRSAHTKVKVLKDISFSVRQGEIVGLIGENGCGKSTALKIISRIIYPDSGSVVVTGRVSSLLELGAGFHPELTGRENIYTNAAIFGLSKREIDDRLGSIIDFSELWDFIDNPVRTYSSGMYMRLAFSVAINVNADILLIDEILAVGDRNFQKKCFNRLEELKRQNVTIIIVTHDTSRVEEFCSRAIWLNDGLVTADGQPSKVVNTYLEYMFEKQLQIDKRQKEEQRKAELAKKDFSKKDIDDLYRKYLNRLPENEETYDHYFDNYERKKDVENSIRNSPEHRALILIDRQEAGKEVSGITREEVVNAYKTYLVREPESEYIIEACCKGYQNVDDLIACIKSSQEYLVINKKKTLKRIVDEAESVNSGPKSVEITDLHLSGKWDRTVGIKTGCPLNISIGYRFVQDIKHIFFNLDIYSIDGKFCFGLSTRGATTEMKALEKQGVVTCKLPALPLIPGNYKLYVSIVNGDDRLIDSKRADMAVAAASAENAADQYPHEWVSL